MSRPPGARRKRPIRWPSGPSARVRLGRRRRRQGGRRSHLGRPRSPRVARARPGAGKGRSRARPRRAPRTQPRARAARARRAGRPSGHGRPAPPSRAAHATRMAAEATSASTTEGTRVTVGGLQCGAVSAGQNGRIRDAAGFLMLRAKFMMQPDRSPDPASATGTALLEKPPALPLSAAS